MLVEKEIQTSLVKEKFPMVNVNTNSPNTITNAKDIY